MGAAIAPHFGQDAASDLTQLLRTHVLIAVQLLSAARSGDISKFKAEDERWTANADQIADFLSRLNHSWPREELARRLHLLLQLTKDEAVARVAGDVDGDVRTIVGQTSKNPRLQAWHTQSLDRLPGLKFLRTLWVRALAGGPFDFVPTMPGQTAFGLEEAHREFQISPEEFDEVGRVLGLTLEHFDVPSKEQGEVLAGFFAHKHEVTTGCRAAVSASGSQTH